MADDSIDEVELTVPEELSALLGTLNEAGEELPDAIKQLIASRILFMPVDLKSHPTGAPEGMTALVMFTEGLDKLVEVCAKGIKDHPEGNRLDTVQFGLNRFAVTGFSPMEIAAMLSVAIEREARRHVAMKEAPKDPES